MGDKGYLNDIVGDLSFPHDSRQQLMSRNTGDLCRHCMLPPDAHTTSESAAAGYEKLGPQIPGVHPDTDSALNSADVYADPRRAEFYGSVRPQSGRLDNSRGR
jgi:hypothetical protein